MDTEHEKYYFEIICPDDVKHQAANVLSCLALTRADKSSIRNDVSVMKLTDAQPRGKNSKTHSPNRYRLPLHVGADLLSSGLLEVSKVSGGTDK